ncbi:MAG: 50S ribosomal protein L9 [Candidatus Omnitrophota bacterium]
MKVIVMKDEPNLGKFGDVMNVKDGYARNYLIPKGLVRPYNKQGLHILESYKKKMELQKQQEKEQAEELGRKLSALSCTVPVKVGESDKLFGSVTSDAIHRALEAEGITVDKKQIMLDEPIKKLGIYNVSIKLHPEVTSSCKVWVVKE